MLELARSLYKRLLINIKLTIVFLLNLAKLIFLRYLKYTITVLLIVFTILLLLPNPFHSKELFVDGFLSNNKSGIYFGTNLDHFEPMIKSIIRTFPVIPNESGYYDLYIYNQNKEYDWSYLLSFPKTDPINESLQQRLSTSTVGDPKHIINYEIEAGTEVLIKGVSVKNGVYDYHGTLVVCGFTKIDAVCPEDLKKPLPLVMTARPNWEFLIFQLVLIVSFWVVVVNNFVSFFKLSDGPRRASNR